MFWFPITPWVTLRLAIFLPWIGRRRESLHQKAQRIALGQRRYQSTSDGFGCSTLCCKWFLFFFFGRGQKRGSGEASLCRCPWWFENEGLAGCAAIFMAFVGLRGTNHRSWNVPPKSGKVSEVSSLISGRSVYNIYIYRGRCNMIKFAQFGKTSPTSATHFTSCASLALPLPGISWLPMLPKIDFWGSFLLGKLFWERQNRRGLANILMKWLCVSTSLGVKIW